MVYNLARQKVQATVAQLAVQTIRNRQVMGSNPIGGSQKIPACRGFYFYNTSQARSQKHGRTGEITASTIQAGISNTPPLDCLSEAHQTRSRKPDLTPGYFSS